jgi:hypothetical protein
MFECTIHLMRRLLGRARTVGRQGERGQATAEYALVLLGVAAIALLLAAWAAKSGKLGELFDAVVDQLISKAR